MTPDLALILIFSSSSGAMLGRWLFEFGWAGSLALGVAAAAVVGLGVFVFAFTHLTV